MMTGWLSTLGLFAGIGLVIAAPIAENAILGFASLAMFIFALVTFIVYSVSILRITKFKDGEFWIKGTSQEFRNSLGAL